MKSFSDDGVEDLVSDAKFHLKALQRNQESNQADGVKLVSVSAHSS